MIPEQAAYEFLRSRPGITADVYFGEAKQGATEPYLIVYPILPGRVGEVKAFFPTLQISCFEADQFKAIELADLVVEETDGYVGAMNSSVYTDSCHSERLQPIRNDDGTWMVPVQLRFSYLKEE